MTDEIGMLKVHNIRNALARFFNTRHTTIAYSTKRHSIQHQILLGAAIRLRLDKSTLCHKGTILISLSNIKPLSRFV